MFPQQQFHYKKTFVTLFDMFVVLVTSLDQSSTVPRLNFHDTQVFAGPFDLFVDECFVSFDLFSLLVDEFVVSPGLQIRVSGTFFEAPLDAPGGTAVPSQLQPHLQPDTLSVNTLKNTSSPV